MTLQEGGLHDPDRDRAHGSGGRSAATDAAIVDTLLASAPVGFALFDADLRFRRINQRLAEINGLSVDEHLGRFAFDLFPDLRASAEAMMRGVIETGVPVRDVEIVGRTLAEPHRDRHWLESFFPVLTPAGDTVGLAAIVTDISERVWLHSELDRTAQLLEAVLHAVPIGVVVTDRAHRVVEANQAFRSIAGLPDDGRVGDRIEGLVEGDLGARLTSAIDAVFSSEPAPTSLALNQLSPEGDVCELEMQLFAVCGPHSSITRAGITLLDVTDRNEREREVKARLRHRLEAHTEALEELQRMLLPELPVLPGLFIDTFYRPAEGLATVGGDWYDCFSLPDGRIVLAVGDAVGHGLAAVRAMDTARNAFRTVLLNGTSLADSTAQCNTVVHLGGPGYVTACVFVIDPVTGEAEYVNAGHPAPVMRHADGSTTTLDGATGTVLGPLPDLEYRSTALTIGPGDALFLYTDGLIERRDADLDVGLAWLTAAVRASGPLRRGSAEALVEHTLQRTPLDHDDDICVLIASPRDKPQ
jgi:phosphoserine phosphatase RsbU/P